MDSASYVERHQRLIHSAKSRLCVVGVMLLLLFVWAAGTMIRYGIEAEPARKNTSSARSTPLGFVPNRADIVDRNGDLLATNIVTHSLYADPKKVLDPVEDVQKLATVFPDMDHDGLLQRLSNRNRRFIWVRRNLTPQQMFEVNQLGLPGFNFKKEEQRVYPKGRLASHILGYTDIDAKGISGMEKAMQYRLADQSEPLHLSIDMRLQHILSEELARNIVTFQAKGGVAMMMDVRSAEIVAMVSLPDFDPNNPQTDPKEARFNQATLGVYEMGSTMKVFNTAMALEHESVTLSKKYEVTQPIRIGRFSIRDFKRKFKPLSVAEIFVYSSNIGSVKMMLDTGIEEQKQFMDKLGFLQPAVLELGEVGRPLYPDPWRRVNAMTISFGHGISINAVQLMTAMAAMVNGGVMHTPTLLKREQPALGTRVISERTSAAMRRLLYLNVTEGSGSRAAAPGYFVGGKTGTAEKTEGDGYAESALLSSFVAAFPMYNPRYALLVIVDEPQGTQESFGYATGGWVAAPVVGRAVARMAPLLGMPPQQKSNPTIWSVLALDKSGNIPHVYNAQ